MAECLHFAGMFFPNKTDIKYKLDLPQVDLMKFRNNLLGPEAAERATKQPSERQSRERSTCLA